jgi:hypothetical protein
MSPNPADDVLSDDEGDWDIVTAPTFSHVPLDTTSQSIRLLTVCPQAQGGIVRCDIVHSTISEDSYDCLSYRWGNDAPSNRILINDKVYLVRDNLYQFLLIAQSAPLLQRRIWIDAICIDQSNAEEKNHQVQQMGLLYANARTVHIWLGPAADSQRQVFSLMISRALWPRSASSPQKPRKHLLRVTNRRSSSTDSAAHNCLDLIDADIARNEYWRRAWIVQEVSLARTKTVWYGLQNVEWTAFCKTFYPLVLEPTEEEEYSEPVLLHDSPLATFIRTNRPDESRSKLPLLQLLANHAAGLHCTDPRDRIYCLLSVASLRTELSADYTLGVRDLFLVTLAECITGACMCAAQTLFNVLSDSLGSLDNSLAAIPSDRIVDPCLRIRGLRSSTFDAKHVPGGKRLYFLGWIVHCLPCRLEFREMDRGWACSGCWILTSGHGISPELWNRGLSQIRMQEGDVTIADPSMRPDSTKGFSISLRLILRMFHLGGQSLHSQHEVVRWHRRYMKHEAKAPRIWPKWNPQALSANHELVEKMWIEV